MPDMEKVKKAITLCAGENKCNPDCPYAGNGCVDALMVDTLAILKEQEVKEQCLKKKCVICPHCENCDVDENGLLKEQETVAPEVEELNEVDRLYRCPRCHKHFFYEKQKYCDQCGQAIKWD